jgi:TonB family protein
MCRSVAARCLISVLLAVIFGLSAPAQDAGKEAERKAVSKVTPAYPELARKLNIHGVVKVGIVIAPTGKVTSAKVIGGNPVLVDAALTAVRKWMYEPAVDETNELVELKFEPHQ